MKIVFPKSKKELAESKVFHKIKIASPYEIWSNEDISEYELSEYMNYIKSSH